MKVVFVSKSLHYAVLFFLLMALTCFICPFLIEISPYDAWTFNFCGSGLLIFMFVIVVMSHSRLCYSRVNHQSITSYFYGIKICEVRFDIPVYYFDSYMVVDGYDSERIIVISNSPINHSDWLQNKGRIALHSYDWRDQIAIPYTEKTRYLFKFSEWIKQ